VKPINISIKEDSISTLNELDEILEELGLSRSLWFRHQMNRYVNKYKSFSMSNYQQ
jgi:hypothetical protein